MLRTKTFSRLRPASAATLPRSRYYWNVTAAVRAGRGGVSSPTSIVGRGRGSIPARSAGGRTGNDSAAGGGDRSLRPQFSARRQMERSDLLHGTAVAALAAAVAVFVGATTGPEERILCEEEKQGEAKNGTEDHPENKSKKDAETEVERRVSELRMCGAWCAPPDGGGDGETTAATPCRMDPSLVPCAGRYCETTAQLWDMNVLGPLLGRRTRRKTTSEDERGREGSSPGGARGVGPAISCALYTAGAAYPLGAVPCDPKCLGPEIHPSRYPTPTGVGVFCRPGTCRPSSSPLHGDRPDLGMLRCPCNWFGSECSDGRVPARRAVRTRIGEGGGAMDRVTIEVEDAEEASRLLKDYRPGCVVRVHLEQRRGEIYEGVYAVLADPPISRGEKDDDRESKPTKIEMIVAPTDPSLRWEVRRVSEFLRSLPAGEGDGENGAGTPTTPSSLYLHPAISGFYNNRYEYLMDYIGRKRRKDGDREDDGVDTPGEGAAIREAIICATGSGIAGAVSAAEALSGAGDGDGKPAVDRIHLYYGVRDPGRIPFADRLEGLAARGVRLTIVSSLPPPDGADGAGGGAAGDHRRPGANGALRAIEEARRRGEEIGRRMALERRAGEGRGENGAVGDGNEAKRRPYVQDVLEHDLRGDGAAASPVVSARNSVFVVCGRVGMMDDVRTIAVKDAARRGPRPPSADSRRAPDDGDGRNGKDEDARYELARKFVEERFFQNV